MGIRGLLSYIDKQSGKFFNKYELHDTKIVIDGSSLMSSLMSSLYSYSNCNYNLGGDYREYAQYISKFFDDLLKCKVEPLVIIDGGIPNKKMDTMCARLNEKLQSPTDPSFLSELK